MAEARGKTEWARTGAILAMLANVNRDPKKQKAFKPSDFNPFFDMKNQAKIQADITALKIFVEP